MEKLIIGLTGPTGSGKTTFSALAEGEGFSVINADEVAHRVTDQNEDCRRDLKEAFGKIFNADGTLDRKALAAKAFRDAASTKKLNQITLPYITREIEILIKEGGDKVLLDAPTLFEAGADRLCFATVGVIAEESLRLKRIISRDGIDEERAKLRISAGKPDSFYRENCHFLIENSGDLETLKSLCLKTIKEITEKFDET